MSVKSELRKLVIALGGTPTKKTVPGLLGEVSTAIGGESTGKTVAEQIYNIAVARGYVENPLDGLLVDFDIAADEDLLGKYISDLQKDTSITNNVISGTSKYVSDYTGFSSKTSEQSGNYIALHASVPGMTIGEDGLGIKVNNKSLDSDGIIVLILTTNNPITVTATKGEFTKTITLAQTNLIKEAEPTNT